MKVTITWFAMGTNFGGYNGISNTILWLRAWLHGQRSMFGQVRGGLRGRRRLRACPTNNATHFSSTVTTRSAVTSRNVWTLPLGQAIVTVSAFAAQIGRAHV